MQVSIWVRLTTSFLLIAIFVEYKNKGNAVLQCGPLRKSRKSKLTKTVSHITEALQILTEKYPSSEIRQ
jgi:hypothetical protein